MTIEAYIRAKEDLEVRLMGVLETYVDAFEKNTGQTVHEVVVTLFKKEFDAPSRPRISDVNIITELSKGGSK